MPSKINALEWLFCDDDPETVGMVKEQLVMQGDAAVGDLNRLANADSPIVSAHAQEVLHAITGRKASEELVEIMMDNAEIPLEKASWLVSGALMPWLDLEESKRMLDRLGLELLVRLTGGDQEPVSTLTKFLHHELGFKGNQSDYHNQENSLLPCVLLNRRGLPLALSLLTIFVGTRAVIPVHGVNLPGHFIVRCGDIYFDPFHKGRIISLADCANILLRQGIELNDCHLENPSSRDVFARMLANLRHAYTIKEANWQVSLVDRWMSLL